MFIVYCFERNWFVVNRFEKIAFLSAVNSAISKFTSIDKRRIDEDKNSALKQIIDNAIIADGVTDVFELVGLDKPNIGLLSDEFLEDVRNLPPDKTDEAIELCLKQAEALSYSWSV